jgi:hypothetical protein
LLRTSRLEALHALLQDQGDVRVLAVLELGPGEHAEHRAPAAVADVGLLAVEQPRAVGLVDRARLQVVGVRAGVGLGQGEGGQLAPGGQVGQEALLLLV